MTYGFSIPFLFVPAVTVEPAGGKEYRPAGGIDTVKPCGVFQVAGNVLLPLPGRQQLLPHCNHIREVQIVNFASAGVAGSAGVIQPAATVQHHGIRGRL